MPDAIDLNKTMDKKTYKQILADLEKRLAALQLEIQRQRIPVVICFDGMGASGKGTLMRRIVHPLDPRLFNVHPMGNVSEDMKMRPFLYPYWINMPSKGRIAIFDRSWCRNLLPERQSKLNMSEQEKSAYYDDVNAFEKQLTDDGTVVIKLFLHISQAEQRARMARWAENPDTAWRVNEGDLAHYDINKAVFDDMIKRSNRSESPWHSIEANDPQYAAIKILNIVVACLEDGIAAKSAAAAEKTKHGAPPPRHAVLRAADPLLSISDMDYKAKLSYYQNKMNSLGSKLYAKRRSVVVVYEGWDAAGKGGSIKRVTAELDPRGYEVIPIAAPSREQLDHHYLWRFHKKTPKDGHIAIFDRSWYGRVLVERVEGLSSKDVWMRAYQEINDMERHWANHGIIIFKFWIDIDKDEQLRRFQARAQNPAKAHKLTDEDWRNRDKWDAYAQAMKDMIARTGTAYAPWTIIDSNNKKLARIKTLALMTTELEARIV